MRNICLYLLIIILITIIFIIFKKVDRIDKNVAKISNQLKIDYININ